MISMLFAPLNRLIVKICSVVWGTVLLWGLGCACAYAQDVVCTRHAVCSLECSCVHSSFPLHNSHAVPCAYVCTRFSAQSLSTHQLCILRMIKSLFDGSVMTVFLWRIEVMTLIKQRFLKSCKGCTTDEWTRIAQRFSLQSHGGKAQKQENGKQASELTRLKPGEALGCRTVSCACAGGRAQLGDKECDEDFLFQR